MKQLIFALKPLRQFADFRGRSTRTELVAFYFLSMFICLFGDLAGTLAGIPYGSGRALAGLLLLCPMATLCVRRLHDSARSGWWMLLALPTFAISARRQFLLWQDPFDFAGSHLFFSVELPSALLSLPIIIFMFAEGQEGINAYGPNPRYTDDVSLSDSRGEAA